MYTMMYKEEISMAQMIRKQIYIDAANEEFLKRRASELGVTEAEVVRQALADAERQANSDTHDESLKNLLAYAREHRTLDVPQADWTFNREEIYDDMYEERFARHWRQHEETTVPTTGPAST